MTNVKGIFTAGDMQHGQSLIVIQFLICFVVTTELTQFFVKYH